MPLRIAKLNNGFQNVEMIVQKPEEAGIDIIIGLKDEENFIYGNLDKVFILEGAMDSGKPSVTLYVKASEDTHIAIECSYNIIQGIAATAKGVYERTEAEKASKKAS